MGSSSPPPCFHLYPSGSLQWNPQLLIIDPREPVLSWAILNIRTWTIEHMSVSFATIFHGLPPSQYSMYWSKHPSWTLHVFHGVDETWNAHFPEPLSFLEMQGIEESWKPRSQWTRPIPTTTTTRVEEKEEEGAVLMMEEEVVVVVAEEQPVPSSVMKKRGCGGGRRKRDRLGGPSR
jgi:hypothetical protein